MALVDDRIGNTASNTIGVFNNEETVSQMTSDDTDKLKNDKNQKTNNKKMFRRSCYKAY